MSANFLNQNKLKVTTGFSGGLAALEFALKYENINHEIVFACEFDKYARKQYLKFHNEPKTFYKDIRDLKAIKYLDQIDLFVWGSPCQDLSLAGKRKGFNGDKSYLFREGARVQFEMKPNIFIFENVKGLLSSNKGADYKEVCDTFRNQGYHIVTLQMNTKDYGVPQNRERIFIVGFLDVNKYHNYKEPKPFKLEKRLKDILETNVDDKYTISDKLWAGHQRRKKEHKEKGNGFGYSLFTHNSEYTSTISARYYKDGSEILIHQENKNPRKLTPREYFRLQGVKDEDINIVVSDTQAYKIAGNAISINVMQYLLKSLFGKSEVNTSIFDFVGV